MMLLHSKLARESCALKNKNLPLLCRGREVSNIRTVRRMGNPLLCRGRKFIVPGPARARLFLHLRYGTVVV